MDKRDGATRVDEFEASERKVFVAARIRPTLQTNEERYEAKCVQRVDDTSVVCTNLTDRREAQHTFAFDCVFDENDDQEAVFTTCLGDLTSLALDGSDITVMAYGQTGSGKTHTLLGERLVRVGDRYQLHPNSGAFLRAMSDLVDYRRRCSGTMHVVLCLTIIEIYLEQIRDLLNNRSVVGFREIGEDLVLTNQTIVEVRSLDDVVHYFDIAYRNRAVASTKLNDESSRSHALFFVDILQQAKSPNTPQAPDPKRHLGHHPTATVPLPYMTERASNTRGSVPQTPPVSARGAPSSPTHPPDPYPVTKSRIALVDLAGSERIKRSGVEGTHLTEALFVNKSLSTLGNVVNNIHAGAKHIPFRDSKMTRILRSSFLSPSSRIVFIANMSPTQLGFSETLGSLRFSHRLKNLKPTAGGEGGGLKKLDNIHEMEYLAKLRQLEEIAADLRVASVACSNYKSQLKPRVVPSVYTHDREAVRATIQNYRRAVHHLEEEQHAKHGSELAGMIQDIVSAHIQERPQLQQQQNKLRSLQQLIEAECATETELRNEIAHIGNPNAAATPNAPNNSTEDSVEALNVTKRNLQQQIDKCAEEFKRLEDERARAQETIAVLSCPEQREIRISREVGRYATYLDGITTLQQEFISLKRLIARVHQDDINRARLRVWSPAMGVPPFAYFFNGVTSPPEYVPLPAAAVASTPIDSDEDGAQSQTPASSREPTRAPTPEQPPPQPPAVVAFEGVGASGGRKSSGSSTARRSRSMHEVLIAKERLYQILDRVERTGELCNDDVKAIFAVLDALKVDPAQVKKEVVPHLAADSLAFSDVSVIIRHANDGDASWTCVVRLLQALRVFTDSPRLGRQTAAAIRNAGVLKKSMALPHFIEVLVQEYSDRKHSNDNNNNHTNNNNTNNSTSAANVPVVERTEEF
eukprot:PhM_4_TR13840/c0_g1_i1/m.79008/K10395/KIF4_21_27; kinesin family member 4/21/27